MTTVCAGWTAPHPRVIVLKDDGVPDGRVSHGMCPDCDREMNGAIDVREHQVAEYAAYMANPFFDPRD